MKILVATIGILSLIRFACAGGGNTPIPLPEDSVKIVHARYAMLDILRGAQVYLQDRGEWPTSVGLLDSLKYVELDSTLRADWTFSLNGHPPTFIRATQNYLAENANKSGFGLPHFAEYDIETGYWRTSARQSYSGGNLALDEQFFLVQEVQSSMFALANAAPISYQDRGTISNVVQLVKNRYVLMPNSVKLNWLIRMYGSIPDSIVATSTDWMPDGAGHVLVYFPAEKRFSGYGVRDACFIPRLTPYLEQVEPAKKSSSKQ